jgi:hypothetical protein
LNAARSGSLAVPLPLFGLGPAARALRNLGRTEKIAGPKVLQHGAQDSWILRGDRPQIDLGEGLGLHAGTKAQAKDRLNVPMLESHTLNYVLSEASKKLGGHGVTVRVRAPTMGRGFVDDVRFGAGREIETPDLGSWSAYDWKAALARGDVKGLTPAESQSLAAKISALGRTHGGQREVREMLRELGVKRIKYINDHEGPGRFSYVALDPGIISTGSIFSKTANAAGAGAVAGVLYPRDADGSIDSDERRGVSGGGGRGPSRARVAERPAALDRQPRGLMFGQRR